MLSIYDSSHSQKMLKTVRLLTARIFLSIPIACLQVTELSVEAYANVCVCVCESTRMLSCFSGVPLFATL